MKRRKESKKTLILFIVLYLLLACAISTVGFLCYLSFDLNQGMKLNRDEIKAEKYDAVR